MKGEDILFAMNEVNKDYIQEAGAALRRSRVRPRRRTLRTPLIAAIIPPLRAYLERKFFI